MRKLRILFFGLAALFAANTAIAQQGIGTHLPDRSSVLELQSTNRGLLIPRVALKDTQDKGPIHGDPAHSLLVYNISEATDLGVVDVEPGFYYWVSTGANQGYWEAFLTNKNFEGKAGDGIYIDEDGNISIDTTNDQGEQGKVGGDKVMVTVEDTAGNTITEWIDINDLLQDIAADNGVEIGTDLNGNPVIQLGGALVKNTLIDATNNSLTINTGDSNFILDNLGLVEVDNEGVVKTGSLHEGVALADAFDVLIVDDNGVVQKVNVLELLKDVVEVENGLYYDENSGTIKLGGDLTEATTITLNEFDFVLDATKDDADVIIKTNGADSNLQLEGLTEVAAGKNANKMLVVDADNNVRTVTRMISDSKTGGFTINATDVSGYTAFVKEVILEVKPSGADAVVNLPTASDDNKGQVINIVVDKTAPINGEHYVEIHDGGTKVREGYEPAKGWVFKSNGTDWILVSEY